MCTLAQVSRAGFYRRAQRPGGEGSKLRDQVQRVALEWPAYGSRRITAELRRRGLGVNRKRVQRLMRMIGLETLGLKPKTCQPTARHRV